MLSFPNVIDVHESNNISQSGIDTIVKLLTLKDDEKKVLEECIFRFNNAEYYGSLINNFEYTSDVYEKLFEKMKDKAKYVSFGDIFDITIYNRYFELLCTLIKQAQYMSSSYDCVVTNPPYLNPSSCGEEMRKFASIFYPISKTDMFAMFIERCMQYLKNQDYKEWLLCTVGCFWLVMRNFEKKCLKTHKW